MSKEGVIAILGVLTAIAPFMGIPHSWLDFLYPVTGLVIMVLALILHRARRDAHARRESAAPAYEAPPQAR